MSTNYEENLKKENSSNSESNTTLIRDFKVVKNDDRRNPKVNIDNLLKDLRAEQKKDRRTNVVISCTLLSAIAGVAIFFNN